jgi:hypothetical protein
VPVAAAIDPEPDPLPEVLAPKNKNKPMIQLILEKKIK